MFYWGSPGKCRISIRNSVRPFVFSYFPTSLSAGHSFTEQSAVSAIASVEKKTVTNYTYGNLYSNNTEKLFLHSSNHLLIPQYVWRRVNSLFQSQFSTEWDLVLHSSNLRFPLAFLRSSSLRFLPRLPVAFTLYPIFPSITCFRRQFLRKKWLIQMGFLLFSVCWIFLYSLTLRNAISTTLVCLLHLPPASHITRCIQVLRSPKEAFAAAMQSWRVRYEKCAFVGATVQRRPNVVWRGAFKF